MSERDKVIRDAMMYGTGSALIGNYGTKHISQSDMKVETRVFPSGLIEQDTIFSDNGVRERLTRQIIDTQEQQVREALIVLGWTPPEEKTNGNS